MCQYVVWLTFIDVRFRILNYVMLSAINSDEDAFMKNYNNINKHNEKFSLTNATG